ncbi:nuclear transport factor 2 family protein [Scytonema millei]|uniref:nuclear transport factor 2 family protein n=1 Tax=Scytonema millei TaxID=1245922 RepID=UPI001911AE35|nr:nuclear transport factor 2 family protein [Scytonema millei]
MEFRSSMAAITQTEIIRSLIGLFEAMDVESAMTYFTEDALYRFGNHSPAVGKAAIASVIEANQFSRIARTSFEINEIWEIDDAVICQMETTHTCDRSKAIAIPCAIVFRMEDDLVREMRVYIDASPLNRKCEG